MSDPNAPVIHIGYHKTGSSWLRKRLFPRVRNARFVERSDVKNNILVPSSFRFDSAVARGNLLSHPGERILISEEELSGNLQTGGLHGGFSKEIAERLGRTFPDAQIVFFIRSQTSMIASAYKQYIKGGGTRNFQGFMRPSNAPHKTPHFSLDFLAYDDLIGHYESIFGRSRVSVFLYEDFCSDPTDFLRRFVERLDLDVDLDSVSHSPVNAGYRSRTLGLLRFLNHFHDRATPNSRCWVGISGFYKMLGALAPRIDRLPFAGRVQQLEDFLDEAGIEGIEDRYRESNERLEKGYALGLAKVGYPMPRGA